MPQAEPAVPDEQFAELLASYDDRLARGETHEGADVSSIQDEELSRRLTEAKSFLSLVEQAWPRGGGKCPSDPGPRWAAMDSQLGRFRLIREAGRGGCGLVFQALDAATGRQVALKVPRPEALLSPELKRRFLHEARAAAALDHPNITAVYEAGQWGPICYIASAWCDGPNLAQWLRERTEPVPLATAATIVHLLADAVQHAHSRGVLHRDLKPANILMERSDGSGLPLHGSMLGLDATPKLTDFGLAKMLQGDSQETRSGAVLGTPAYMAPEQASSDRTQVGPATDVYALGVVLYELVTGLTPHVGKGEAEILRKIVETPPENPRRLRPDLDRNLSAITLKCLEKRPLDRYASAAGLRDDLMRYLSGEPVTARPVPSLVRVWRWSCRQPVLASLAAALVVAVVVGFVGILWQWRRAEGNYHRSLERLAKAHQILNSLYPVGDNIAWDVRAPEFQESFKQQFVTLYEDLLSVETDDLRLAVELAGTHGRYAALLDSIGRREEASRAFEQAIDRWRELVARDPSDLEASRGLAKTLVLGARTRRIRGDFAVAWHWLVEAESLLSHQIAQSPDDMGSRRELAICLLFQGKVKHKQNDPAAATELLARAQSTAQRAADLEPASLVLRHTLFAVLDDLILVSSLAGRDDVAVEACGQFLEEARRLGRDFPDAGEYDGCVARCARIAARFSERAGQSAEALAAYDIAVRCFDEQRRRERDRFRFAIELIDCHRSMARIHKTLDRAEKSTDHLHCALEAARQLAANERHASFDPPRLSYRLACIAKELLHSGRREPALAAIAVEQELREKSTDAFSAPSLLVGKAYFALGDFFAEVGDDVNELLHYTLAAASIEPLLTTPTATEIDFLRAAEARYWSGHTHREFGDWRQARESYDKAIGALDNLLKTSPDHGKARGLLGKAHHFQAQVHEVMGDEILAAKHHRLAVTLLEPLAMFEPDVVAECLQTSQQWLSGSP